MFMGKVTRPNPRSRDIEVVSGLYGPGAYIAWVLCTISAIIGTSTKPDPSKVYTDLIASFIYSTVSTYWVNGRYAWFYPKGVDILEDCSLQAGSFVFNVSAFLHDLGFLLCTEGQRVFCVPMIICDLYWANLSPMASGDTRLGTNPSSKDSMQLEANIDNSRKP
ncbi:hypothetical protein CPB86DRAFT_830855 [Serendipita vermifera]|nr:hypothetical protein CPB86DRAFT_830855 [Serendipita vermifera]